MPLHDAVIGMLVVCSQEPADPEIFLSRKAGKYLY